MVAVASLVTFIWLADAMWRHVTGLAAPAYDLAYFQQIVWNLGHGRGFTSSFSPGNFLGLHFSPLLAVPAVIELVWTDPRALQELAALCLALAIPAAFLLLRAAFRPSRHATALAAALSVPLPLSAVVQEAAVAGFHTEVMALPLALMAGWAGLTRRTPVLWGCALLALMAKEDQSYTVACIGLLVIARGGPAMRRHGAGVLAAAVVWGVLVFTVVMPALRGSGRLDTDDYYGWLGGGWSSLLAPIRQPGAVWAAISRPGGWLIATGLILGLAGLPLLRPRWACLLLPPLLADLLSHNSAQAAVHLQYGLPLIVPAVVATAMGGRRLLFLAAAGRRRLRLRGTRRASLTIALAAVPALVVAGLTGDLPPGRVGSPAFAPPSALAELQRVTARLPAGAAVATDDDLAAPLASRAQLFLLPNAPSSAYVVVDRDARTPGYGDPEARDAVVAELPLRRTLIVGDGRFELWSPDDG